MTAVYRLVRAERASEALSGEGARLYGGRWNPPGAAVVYAAESRALAVLETMEAEDVPSLATRAGGHLSKALLELSGLAEVRGAGLRGDPGRLFRPYLPNLCPTAFRTPQNRGRT